MKLDRKIQLEILQQLAESYPNQADEALEAIESTTNEETMVANLLYLEEHGLIISGIKRMIGGEFIFVKNTEITAKGMDFIADDGGLSAILGVVTVKLHDDTLKQIIEAKILQSDLNQPDKKRWIDQLRSLPAETTKHLVLKLVDLGLENGPSAIRTIGSVIGLGDAL